MSVRDWFRRDFWITDRDMDEEADDLGALLVATGELGPETDQTVLIDWTRFSGLDSTVVLRGQLDAVRADRDGWRAEVERLLDERGYWVALIRHVTAQRDEARGSKESI
jgi:hypothetical protein